MSKFSERLRNLRKRAGFTQPELAEKLGLSKGAVGNWEAEANEPERDTLRKIADLLGTSESFLIGETDMDGVLQEDPADYRVLKMSDMTVNELEFIMTSRQKELADPAIGVQRKRVLLGQIAELALELQKRIPQSPDYENRA